jgi:hypothetical protein
MNELTANLILRGAQLVLDEKFSGCAVTICAGVYDNYPYDIANMIANGQPVKCAISMSGEKTEYREFVLTPSMQVRIVRPEKTLEEMTQEELKIALDKAVKADQYQLAVDIMRKLGMEII